MLLKYLLPESPIAVIILVFLGAIFVIWLISLILKHIYFRHCLKDIKNFNDIGLLKDALDRKTEGKIDPDQAIKVYKEFISQKKLNESNPISIHLNVIYEAGIKGTNLEVGELLKHTAKSLFKEIVLFRATLATFIIIGLFGTLFGLADSLSKISGGQTTNLSSAQFFDRFGPVFTSLKSVFAPSIFGVLFTILGVYFYNTLVRFDYLPLLQMVESATLSIWVPNLIPTTAQKFNENVHQTFEAAKKIVDTSRDIETKTGALSEVLEQAAGETSKLTKSSANINAFSKSFVIAVEKLDQFQKTIKNLYSGLVNGVQESINQTEESHNKIVQLLNKATDVLSSAIITQGLKELSDNNSQTLENLGNKLSAEMSTFSDHMHAWNAPIEQAAQVISGSMSNTIARNAEFENGLKLEFTQLQQKLADQEDKRTEQNSQIEKLYLKIDGSIGELDKSYHLVSDEQNKTIGELNKSFKETIEVFGEKQNSAIEENIKTFGSMRIKLSESITNFENHQKTLIDELQMINKGQAELSKNLSSTSASISDLAKAIANIQINISALSAVRDQLQETAANLDIGVVRIKQAKMSSEGIIKRAFKIFRKKPRNIY